MLCLFVLCVCLYYVLFSHSFESHSKERRLSSNINPEFPQAPFRIWFSSNLNNCTEIV